MSLMISRSNFSRAIFTSPWSLLLFCLIPFLFILKIKLNVPLLAPLSMTVVLLNNLCFSLMAGIRLLFYLARLRKEHRYGATVGRPSLFEEQLVPCAKVRTLLTGSGYRFSADGSYGEKRDKGYWGMLLLYAGLLLCLFLGSMDNLRQFSGVLLHGVGKSIELKKLDTYRQLVVGPLVGESPLLPKMRILRQILPDVTYPRGATEALFLEEDGKEHGGVLKHPDIFRSGPYDIYMTGMIYEPHIQIVIDGTEDVLNEKIMLKQLPQKVDGFGFFAPFKYGNLDGELFYQPEKSRLKVLLRQGTMEMLNKEMLFQVDREQSSGNLTVRCNTMGVWTEIHVVRRRHMPLVLLGGGLAVVGLILRLAIRPRRVWLEETPQGCRVFKTRS